MKFDQAPIALFVFKRPEKTRTLLEQISSSDTAKRSPLIIFSEGARNEEESQQVKEVRQLIKSRSWVPNIEIVERNENWGLFRSLFTGVSQVCDDFEEAIILEDDLELSASFFPFMVRAMEKYRHENRVFQVTGYSYPVDLSGPCDSFFINHSSCWGWGTWKRAWQKFETDPNHCLKKIEGSPSTKNNFNIQGGYDYYSLLKMQAEGKINSWGILWYATIFLNDGLILMPRKSLVANRGDDSASTHYGANAYPDRLYEIVDPTFPEAVEQDVVAYNKVSQYLKYNSPLGGGGLVKKLKKAILRKLFKKPSFLSA